MRFRDWHIERQVKLNEVLNMYLMDFTFSKFVNNLMKHGEKRKSVIRITKMLMYIKMLTFLAPSFLIKTAVLRCIPLLYVRRIPKYNRTIYQPKVYKPFEQLKKSIQLIFNNIDNKTTTEQLGILLLNCCFKQGTIFKLIRESNKDIANPLIKWKRALNVIYKKYPKNRRKKRKIFYIYNKYSISYWIRRTSKVRYS